MHGTGGSKDVLRKGPKQATSVVEMAGRLEEELLSSRLHVKWDLDTPASVIVEKLREKDLAVLQSLEKKCKDQLVAIAFKLARGLKVAPFVALLLVARSSVVNSIEKKTDSAVNGAARKSDSAGTLVAKKADAVANVVAKQAESFSFPVAKKVDTVVNGVTKKIDSTVVSLVGKMVDAPDDCLGGTLVDLLLGMALAHSTSCSSSKLAERPSKCKSYLREEGGNAWPGEASGLYRKCSADADEGFGLEIKLNDSPGEWEGTTSDSKDLKDFSKWDESFSGLKSSKDSGDWEEVTSKSRKKSGAEVKDADGKCGRTPSFGGEQERPTKPISLDDKCAAMGIGLETNCEIARKLLECLLIFGPRLSAHAQSPYLAPLLRAAQGNDETLICLLLNAGAPVNERDADGNTALHWALRQATPVNKRTVNAHVVTKLLDAGANVLTGNKLGATPVHTAAGHGHFEALSLILEKDAGGVNVMAATKETPLHYAVKNNHLLCAALLLKHGANRNVASLRNQKPLQLAPSLEMRALLLVDDKTLREQSWESIMASLALVSSQSSPLFSLAPLQPQFESQISCISETSTPSFLPSSSHFASHPSSQAWLNSRSTSAPQLGPSPLSQWLQSPSLSPSPPSLSASSQDGNPFDWLTAQSQFISGRELGQVGEGKDSVNLPQYKTVMCRFFASNEGCAWGSKCHFAHSGDELLSADRFESLDMRAAAGQGDGDGGDQAVKNFKTKLCTHYEKTGKCPHSLKCMFAHGSGELRAFSSFSSIRPVVKSEVGTSTSNSLGSTGSNDKNDDDISARKVFVGGLPHFIQYEELWEFFDQEFGKVVDAVVICGVDADGNTCSRGFGFVVFEDPKHADIAVRRHYLPFRGKKVEVKRATARVDYNDDPSKLTSSLSSSSLSRPVSSGSSRSVVGLSKQEVPVPTPTSATVPQQAWSLPPLAVDSGHSLGNGIQPSSDRVPFFREQGAPQFDPSNSGQYFPEPINHVISQNIAPPLFTASGTSDFSAQDSGNCFPNFRSIFPQSARSLDSGLLLDANPVSFLEPVVGPSSLHTYPSPPLPPSISAAHPFPHSAASNGSSFDRIAPRPSSLDINHKSRSLFSNPASSLYQSYDSNQDNDEELSKLLALLQG